MNPLSIFAGPYAALAKWGVIALLAVAVGVFGWIKGNEHGTQKLIDYQAAQVAEGVKVITKQGKTTERVITKYVDRVRVVEGKTRTIEKEVTTYVESKPLALACFLDNRWVRLHDAAAAGAIPEAAGAADDAPGTITAAGALPTITQNYAVGNKNSARLDALQEWVREQYKATNGEALGY